MRHLSQREVRVRLSAVIAMLCSGVFASAIAGTSHVTFDHSTNQNQSAPVHAADGDTLRITIENTCPALFTYAVAGSQPVKAKGPRSPTGKGSGEQECTSVKPFTPTQLAAYFAKRYCKKTSHDLFVVYNKKYAGYVITVMPRYTSTPLATSKKVYNTTLKNFISTYKAAYRNKNKQQCIDSAKNAALMNRSLVQAGKSSASKVTPLHAVTETVTVTKPGSYVELAGGVTLSQLTDPRYSLGANPAASGGPQVIVEDRNAENSWDVGFAGFIHVHDPNCDWWECRHFAMSLGLGISKASNVSVFIGPSYRLAGKWFVTAGYNFGSIDRLPNGDRVGQPPLGANDLNNLQSRTAGAFFFSFSYAFLKPTSAFFQKELNYNPQVTQTTKKPASTKK